jgi:hypothetical protein
VAVHHDKNDSYMLQEFVQGYWHDVRTVRKAGGANTCRSQARISGNPHRVINLSKGKAIYTESK